MSNLSVQYKEKEFKMASFKKLIQDFADQLGWNIEWEDGCASVDFEFESGDVVTLYITDNDETVEFDVLSEYSYESEDDIDTDLAVTLLKRNAELSVGAWVLEEVEDEWYFSVMYNEDLDNLENMDYDELEANLNIILTEARSVEE